LRGSIRQGHWKPGELIPTETELCRQFSASRATIRKALDALTLEGVISRKARRGTWVTEDQPAEQWLIDYKSDYPFAENVKLSILATESVTTDISDGFFSLFGSEKILTRIKVLRTLNETPLSLSEIYLQPDHASRVCESFDPERDRYFFEVLKRTVGIRINEVHDIFSAVSAAGEVAKRLQVLESSPLTLISRVFFEKGHRVVQTTRVYLRPDVNKLKIVRKVL
jgi:GntR family transcriptional regulator